MQRKIGVKQKLFLLLIFPDYALFGTFGKKTKIHMFCQKICNFFLPIFFSHINEHFFFVGGNYNYPPFYIAFMNIRLSWFKGTSFMTNGIIYLSYTVHKILP